MECLLWAGHSAKHFTFIHSPVHPFFKSLLSLFLGQVPCWGLGTYQ